MWFLQFPSFTILQFFVFLLYSSVLTIAGNSPNPNSLTDTDTSILSSVPWIWRLVLAFGRINTIATVITCLITSLNIIVYKLRQIQEANLQEALNDISFLPSEKACRRFTLDEIKSTTNGFDEALVIGQGGFGKVYKGVIDNGTVAVAIKRLNLLSKQGPHEFKTEINLLSQFRHSHIITLIGYCHNSSEMILVYEYMVNGTLADHLYRRSSKNGNNCIQVTPLSWEMRLKICIGAGRGLDYLHTGTGVKSRIIQRDVKSANILLDENWMAKISDFGLAKIGPANQSCTHVSTNVKGTFGYLDPEYFLTHRLTRKADVYAFGVVLFEVLCGRRAVDSKLGEDQKSLARWAQLCVKEGTVDLLVDPCLKSQILPDSLKEYVRIAEQCLNIHPKKRPTMAEVVAVLESSLELQVKTDSTFLEWNIFNSGPFGNEDNTSSSGEHQEGNNDNIIKLNKSNSEKSPVKTNRKFTAFGRMAWDSLFGSTDRATSANGVVKTSKNSNTDIRKGSIHQVTPTFKLFTYAELKTATKNFSPSVQIGEHDSQYDFIGWIDEIVYEPSKIGVGMAVAVKMFDLESFQELDVELFGRLKHPNLVSTLGYCLKDKKVFLVYEYMQNGSLENWLFNKDKPLPWDTRLKIAIGIARGLTFLYNRENQIIYCSLRTSIILLDEDFNAKLSNLKQTNLGTISSYSLVDSYTPSLVSGDVDNHVYEAPECLLNGDMSEKSDAYRFGVLLLELMTARRATDAIRPRADEISLNWARIHLLNEQKLRKSIDPRLHDKYPLEGANKVALLIQECLTPRCQPSVEQVLRSLEDIIKRR